MPPLVTLLKDDKKKKKISLLSAFEEFTTLGLISFSLFFVLFFLIEILNIIRDKK